MVDNDEGSLPDRIRREVNARGILLQALRAKDHLNATTADEMLKLMPTDMLLATARNWCRTTAERKQMGKPRFDKMPVDLPPQTEWGARLRGYKPGGFWSPFWGPRPESGKCWAPAADIARWRAMQ